MKIGTRLGLISASSLFVLVLIAVVLLYSTIRLDKMTEKEALAHVLGKEIEQQYILMNDFILYKGKRAKTQWYLRYKSINSILNMEDFDRQDEQVILKRISDHLANIQEMFTRLTKKYENRRYEDNEPGPALRQLEEILISRILVESKRMTSDKFIFDRIIHTEINDIIRLKNFLVIVLSFFSLVAIAIISINVKKSIIKPVTDLKKGTEIIGAGDLDYKVGTDSKDEMGDLSRSIDEMTLNLKKSRILLENEISERKKAEEKIKELAKFPSENPYPVLRINENGDILYRNEAVHKLLINEKLSEDRLPEILPGNLKREIREALTTDTPIGHLEVDIGQRTYSYSIAPVAEKQYVNVYATDITERKEAENQLMQYKEGLEDMVEKRTKQLQDAQDELIQGERLSLLGKISSSLAHEIKNPLGVIDSSVYYLKMKLKDADEKTLGHLDRIRRQVEASAAIVESLRSLTRISVPQKSRIDIVHLIKEWMAGAEIPEGINVIYEMKEDKLPVNADREQLVMVFRNIMENAVQAMQKKGTLRVNAFRDKDNFLNISFRDSGPGINPEKMEKIFQPFFTTKARGIGFGLTLCRTIIERHGGTIEVSSEEGKGATFTIRLP